MKLMRAKMGVLSVVDNNWGPNNTKSAETVRMAPVAKDGGYPSDGSDEDNSFARWSPSGSLELTIANPDLWGKIVVGDKFYVDFEKVTSARPVEATNFIT